MDRRIRDRLLSLAAVLLTVATATAAQQADSLPPGVTPAMVSRGRAVFLGAGLCHVCHGLAGKGGIGPDLTDTLWLHHDGSYESLVRQIAHGIDLKASKTGQIMPPRGGSGISDEDLRAVAAYVWALSRRGSPARSPSHPARHGVLDVEV